jgi:two-component system, OmpR family, sensor histidine kinase CpxA
MTIFLRSFLTFWFATVVIISISFGLVLMTHHFNFNRAAPVSVPLPDLQACLQTTIQARSAGRFTQVANQCGLVYILDPSRSELLASTGSPVARSLAAEVTPSNPLALLVFRNEVTMVAFDAPINNAHFVAVATLRGKANGPPPLLWWQFAVAAVVSAVTCFLLTGYFIDPIRRLQRSTESFGRGNLDSRPDASLLARKDELGDLSRTISQMSTRIGTLLSFQKNFLIQVSHELGSPLSRMNVALALARRKANPALLPELNRIQGDSSELNSMVQQLLRLARLESGLEQEEEDVYSLHELLQQVCLDNQFTAEQTRKQVRLLFSPQLNMRGYRELLKRALDNILRNAIRFTPDGGRVEVDVLYRPNDLVVIQVKDSGIGVQDDKLEAIFEPFVRASSDRSGAGLGLAIARQAVHANRGTIRALNRVEGGLLIEITLPYVSSGLAESALRRSSTSVDS